MEIEYVLAGAFTGFIVGLTGVGGGALMTPILILLFNISPVTAVATDLWFAATTKLVGARIHHANGKVDWQVALRLWSGSIPMALSVVSLIGMGVDFVKVSWLNTVIGSVVVLTAFGMLIAPNLLVFATRLRLYEPGKFKSMQPPMTVFFGAVLGMCVAVTSIGAGALGSLVLLYLYPLRMTPGRLIATDIVHAIPLAFISGLGYLFAGKVNEWMLLNLLIGSIPAVILGSILAGRLQGRWLRVFLAFVLLFSGLKILSII